MKVNIISDIHATIDKDLNVVYDEPKKNPSKLKNTITMLKDCLIAHQNEFDDGKVDVVEHFNIIDDKLTNQIGISTYSDMVDFIIKFESMIGNGCNNINSQDDALVVVRSLRGIERFLLKNKIEWSYKKDVLTFSKAIDMFFKYVYDFDPSKLESADYLVIAGDLGIEPIYDLVLEDIKKKTEGKFKKVLHIAGNHDHWWHRIDKLSEVKPDGVNLEHDYCEWVDGDYAFVGCTLWTPIADRDIWTIGRNMNDYNYTPKFSPYASRQQYEIQSEWLRDKLAKYSDKKVVVFTHHQPFEELTADDYKHNGRGWDYVDVNAAYVVLDHSLDDINEKYHNIVLWACGHTHQCYDGILHGIRVIRNPIGYRDVYGYIPPENPSHSWYNKVIEI